MGASGSCVGGAPVGAAPGVNGFYGKVSETKMKPEEYAVLMKSVDDLMDIKDGPTLVGVHAFKGLFIQTPESFAIFEFEGDDW
jgi:hypothetical protein